RPSGPAEIDPRAADGLRPAEAMRLALEDARRAALARNGDDYTTALQRAAEVLEAHFDPEAGTTTRFRQGLADLRRRSVETDLPDLTDTVTLANRLAREIEHARRDAAAAEPAAGD
ncbi:MAG: uroporphyrinogen-III C-methyltransferase, partial [Halofilum sp. (in: g-proteobacteria)]|nr:uroporphyrinogen-III C-methyltransferase [Halofilum sp. (in: g-proteobacteria)]